MGDKSNDDVIDLLKTSRVLCYTGKFDGYPYVIAEAMATGIPIVAYEQQELELFKACPAIIQCSGVETMGKELLSVFESNNSLSRVAQCEKDVFLDIYDNNKIK